MKSNGIKSDKGQFVLFLLDPFPGNFKFEVKGGSEESATATINWADELTNYAGQSFAGVQSWQVDAKILNSLLPRRHLQFGTDLIDSEEGGRRLLADSVPHRHAGLKALASLRMEKGYRDYGHDIDNTDPVLDAGLGFAVDLDKPGGFIGRDAVLTAKAAGPPTRRLVQVQVLDPEPLMFHGEVVHRNGVPLGYVRAASYGFTLGGAVGLAMVEAGEPVTAAYLREATWEVDIAGRRYPAITSLRPLYDPTNERIKS